MAYKEKCPLKEVKKKSLIPGWNNYLESNFSNAVGCRTFYEKREVRKLGTKFELVIQ